MADHTTGDVLVGVFFLCFVVFLKCALSVCLRQRGGGGAFQARNIYRLIRPQTLESVFASDKLGRVRAIRCK